MILVLLGTQNNSFIRLLNKIEECIDKKIIEEKVIAQTGYTKFSSSKIETFDFKSGDEINKLISQANLIITHGGVGSILACLKQNKKVIAVARLKKFSEHVNNHQIQIIDSFDSNGYIIGAHSVDELTEILNNISFFTPNKFISNNQNMLKIIEEYIDKN